MRSACTCRPDGGPARELKIEGGVLVDFAEGRAATAGVRAGDLILQMNNVEIKDAAQFNALVAKLDPKKSVAVLVRRENVTQLPRHQAAPMSISSSMSQAASSRCTRAAIATCARTCWRPCRPWHGARGRPSRST
jgi:predicted metalloprotease with PDZ domain